MRVMAIDYGDARIGIAVSDMGGAIVGEAFTITAYRFEDAAEKVVDAARERDVKTLVLGDPKNMDGSLGPRAEKTRQFSEVLHEKSGLPVVLCDERRTTVDAERILKEVGQFGKKRKQKIDAVAASLILEGYLAMLQNKKTAPRPETEG